MAITSYSTKFNRELDATQYLELLGYDHEKDPELIDVNRELRDFIHKDLMCPSCGVRGAILVSGAQNKTRTRKVRQPHFRYSGSNGEDIHDELCDLREAKPFKDISTELVSFTKARSSSTRIIASFLARAIENNLISRFNIANFRVWHLNVKKHHMVKINVTSNQVQHYQSMYCRKLKREEEFNPMFGELEKLNWNLYGLDRIALQNDAFMDISNHDSIFIKPADFKKIIKGDMEVFDVRFLDDEYNKLLRLKRFISLTCGEKFNSKYEMSFLDAFVGLLLFVNNWSYEQAQLMYIEISCLPTPLGVGSDNIISLNPFKDYQSLKTILNMNDVYEHLLTKENFDDLLGFEVEILKYEHATWKLNQR
ncbi:hypothetical protein [Vibrio fluvialis]|uniref:hypothetical protein n=1 Tax=Vibrio fluvialis TaxID=676 RepID=UPI001F443E0B|nr:hypothetical protein [Vibrio fluvialis]MCE7604562.1 hypothetical protein [Vibrio fluvialis]